MESDAFLTYNGFGGDICPPNPAAGSLPWNHNAFSFTHVDPSLSTLPTFSWVRTEDASAPHRAASTRDTAYVRHAPETQKDRGGLVCPSFGCENE